jgi:hypothetical protein
MKRKQGKCNILPKIKKEPETNTGIIPKVFACVTMWRETKEEMEGLISSIKLLIDDQLLEKNRNQDKNTDYFELES